MYEICITIKTEGGYLVVEVLDNIPTEFEAEQIAAKLRQYNPSHQFSVLDMEGDE